MVGRYLLEGQIFWLRHSNPIKWLSSDCLEFQAVQILANLPRDIVPCASLHFSLIHNIGYLLPSQQTICNG